MEDIHVKEQLHPLSSKDRKINKQKITCQTHIFMCEKPPISGIPGYLAVSVCCCFFFSFYFDFGQQNSLPPLTVRRWSSIWEIILFSPLQLAYQFISLSFQITKTFIYIKAMKWKRTLQLLQKWSISRNNNYNLYS